MAGFFYTIRAKLTAKTVPPERAAASFASFSPVVTWGKSFEDRYRHWDKEQKPTRSSIQELTIYKKFIGPIAQGKKVLVLGPTPELRDFAAGCNATVVVADISPVCIEEATKYLTTADPRNEQRIVGNWLSLPFPDGYFDIVLGDMVLNQFPPDTKEREFLREMRRICAAAGKFVSRFIFTDPDFLPKSLPDAVQQRTEDPSLSRQEKVQAIAIMSLGCTYDRSSRLNNLYGAWKVLEELCATKEIGWRARSMVRDAIQHLKNNGLPGGRWWTYPSETGLMRLITEYFDITERAYATDQPFGRFLPVMSCAPKRSTQQPSPLHVDNP